MTETLIFEKFSKLYMGVINKISEDCSRELVTVTFDRLPPRIHCFNFNIYGAKQNPYMLPSEILIIDFMRTTNSPAAVLAWYLLRTFFCTHYQLRRPINATISDLHQIFIAEHRLSPFTSRMSSYRFLSCVLRDPTVTHCSQGLLLITLLQNLSDSSVISFSDYAPFAATSLLSLTSCQ